MPGARAMLQAVWPFFTLLLITLWAGPVSATPENPPAYFNPTVVFDLTPQPESKHKPLIEKLQFTGNKSLSVEDYLNSTFEYLNRRLGLANNKDYTLKPMIGFDMVRSYDVGSNIFLTPEVYAVYRYDAVDDNVESRLIGRDALQAGFALGLKTSDSFSATLRFDSDVQPGARDHRVLLAAKLRW